MLGTGGSSGYGASEIIAALVERRVSLGLTQADVAVLMESHQPLVARVETGGLDFQMSTLLRYAEALGVTFGPFGFQVERDPVRPDTARARRPGRMRGRPRAARPLLQPAAVTPNPAHVLTARQRRILTMIRESIERRGFAPSMREIGEAVGLASTSSVAHQLGVLSTNGFIQRDPGRPRVVNVVTPGESPASTVDADDNAPPFTLQETVFVPLVRPDATGDLTSEDDVVDTFPLPRYIVGQGTAFMLAVPDGGMKLAGINRDDWVVALRHRDAADGDTVVARHSGVLVVRTIQRYHETTWFMPCAPGYDPLGDDEAEILGRVVSLVRRF